MAKRAVLGVEKRVRELKQVGDEMERLAAALPDRSRTGIAAYERLRSDPQMSEVTRQLADVVVDSRQVAQTATQRLRDAVCRQVQKMSAEELRDLVNGCGGPLSVKVR